jgi:peptide subunit release factor 1 (eRF1)
MTMKSQDLSLLLSRTHNNEPCTLSVYLNIDQAQPVNLNRGFETELKKMASSVRGLAQPERDRFKAAIQRVNDFVSAYTPAAKGVVLFFDTSDGFFWHSEIEYPITNQIRWDRELLLQPLINALDELEPYAVVLADRVKSRVLVAGLGQIEEVAHTDDNGRRVRHVKTTGTDHAESSNRYQKKADNQIRANLRAVIAKLQTVVSARTLHRLILAGTPEITAELRKLLPARLALTILGSIDLPITARTADILRRTRPIAEKFERETEVQKVNHIVTTAAKNGAAVMGLRQTLKAVNANRVWELIYAGGFLSPGYECPECTALFLSRVNRCESCESRVQPVRNVVERAVEHARRKRAKVEVVTGRAAAALETAGGIGALLKEPDSKTASVSRAQ